MGVLRVTTGRKVRAAAFFHNHPSGSAIPTPADIMSIEMMAKRFPSVAEFHVFAVAHIEVDGQPTTQVGHYVTRNSSGARGASNAGMLAAP